MEPMMGQIQLFPFKFAPRNWAFCNGQNLSIAEYGGLFSLIGTTFGGDGRTNFGLPSLKGPDADTHYCIALEGTYPSRG